MIIVCLVFQSITLVTTMKESVNRNVPSTIPPTKSHVPVPVDMGKMAPIVFLQMVGLLCLLHLIQILPPPPPPTGMHEHFKNENKIAQGNHLPDHNYYIFIHLNHSLIQQAFFFLGTSTGKTYFWVAASQVLLQFRLDHVVNSTLRLTHSSPEAHYIRTVDFDHRKQLVCWVRNLFKIKSR